MSRHLGNVKARQVRRLLRRLGYEQVPKRGKGSHEQYRHPQTGKWTTLSWKENDGIPVGTLKRIASDLEMSTKEFLERL